MRQRRNMDRRLPESLQVQVYIPHMRCVARSTGRATHNDRDEIYFLFSGRSPAGLVGGRLPRNLSNDSYYEYWVGDVHDQDADWTNHDQAPVGRPVIWSGTLAPGQSAEFVVALMEQGNQGVGAPKQRLAAGLAAAEQAFGSDAEAGAIVAAACELVRPLPEGKGDDLIGAFAIQVCNAPGRLHTTFIPIQDQMTPASAGSPAEVIAQRENAQTALFDCNGDNRGHYRVIAAARIGPALPIRTYLGKAIDRCGEALLAVEGGPGKYMGFYHVGKGKAAWVPVAAPRFAWYCQTCKRSTMAPSGTNLVNAHRSAGADRQIIWYCYDEHGARPAYKPNRTWVRISAEIDQCAEALLVVEGVGGFYHLAAGQQRWVPLADRQFHWYRDISQACTTAPEEINLVLAKRSTHTRQITWEYCREVVSLQPYTRPDDTKVLIGRETDQCGDDRLTVFGDGGFYVVRKGQEQWVPISNVRFHWLCGTSLEASTAPDGTNLLLVKRHPTTREITWLCYRSTAPTDPYRQPDSTEIYLGTEIDQCGAATVQVVGVEGKVTIAKGMVNVPVRVAFNRFDWWCSGSLQHTTAPALTNLIKVSREADGRKLTWKCYLHR